MIQPPCITSSKIIIHNQPEMPASVSTKGLNLQLIFGNHLNYRCQIKILKISPFVSYKYKKYFFIT